MVQRTCRKHSVGNKRMAKMLVMVGSEKAGRNFIQANLQAQNQQLGTMRIIVFCSCNYL